jgi:GDPmannose 4,6-dehydratase
MAKALLFGVNGQDGHYLHQLLRDNGYEVIGVSRSKGEWIQGNVAEPAFVKELLIAHKPELVFHLAATSSVSHELLQEHQDTIVTGTLNILENVFYHLPQSRVFVTGSGLQFLNSGKPISEKTEFVARDAYSLARIQSVYAARYYRSKGVRVFVGYLFHHDSPFRKEKHLNRSIVNAAKAAAAGKNEPLMIGDISVEKEFGFAGDIAKGIFQLIRQDEITEACIGTGKAYSIERWLELCFGSVHINWKEHVKLKNNYKADFKKLVSNSSLLRSTGWKPVLEIEDLARMMMAS